MRAPTEAEIGDFYACVSRHTRARVQGHAGRPVARRPQVGLRARLGGPAALFRLPAAVASPFTTGLGSYTVTPLDAPVALGAVPLEPPARRSPPLSAFARRQAYEMRAQAAEAALNRTICLRDDLPSPAVVSVSTYLPFLALSS